MLVVGLLLVVVAVLLVPVAAARSLDDAAAAVAAEAASSGGAEELAVEDGRSGRSSDGRDGSDGDGKGPSAPRPKRSLQEVLAIAGKEALGGGLPGAIAAALQVLILMPLRTVTNYQYRYSGSFSEAVAALLKSGGIPRLYEGLPFALVQGPLARFGATAANAGVRALLQNMALTEDLPLIAATALAAVAAGCWRLVLMPIDVCKTVAQVQGAEGLRALLRRVAVHRDVTPLYQGAIATAVASTLGHLPFWTTHGYLNECIPRPGGLLSIVRNGFIGFMASAVADLCTNSIRVVKTTKQSAAAVSSLSYIETIQVVLAADGYRGLFGRGLGSRILTNGVQSVLFTILWEALREGMADSPPPLYDVHGGRHGGGASKEQQEHHIRGPPQPVASGA